MKKKCATDLILNSNFIVNSILLLLIARNVGADGCIYSSFP